MYQQAMTPSMPSGPASFPRLLAALLGLGSALSLAAAFWFQHVEGLEPCPLCVYQRWAHGVSLAVAMASVIFISPRLAAAMLAGLAATFLAGTAIAVWHVMVEWHWLTVSACSAAPVSAATIEELESALLATNVVRCDEVPWSLGGISMAGWNAIVSFILAGTAIAGCLGSRRIMT